MYQLNQQETQYQQALASANDFTPEDLEANREGRMTERQRAKLKFGFGMMRLGLRFFASD